MGTLGTCIPFPLDEKTLEDVISKAKDWAIMHGAAMRSKNEFSEDSLQVFRHFTYKPYSQQQHSYQSLSKFICVI